MGFHWRGQHHAHSHGSLAAALAVRGCGGFVLGMDRAAAVVVYFDADVAGFAFGEFAFFGGLAAFNDVHGETFQCGENDGADKT